MNWSCKLQHKLYRHKIINLKQKNQILRHHRLLCQVKIQMLFLLLHPLHHYLVKKQYLLHLLYLAKKLYLLLLRHHLYLAKRQDLLLHHHYLAKNQDLLLHHLYLAKKPDLLLLLHHLYPVKKQDLLLLHHLQVKKEFLLLHLHLVDLMRKGLECPYKLERKNKILKKLWNKFLG